MNFAVRVLGWYHGKARSFAENIIPSNFHGNHFHISMLHFSLNSEFLLTHFILIFRILSVSNCPCIKFIDKCTKSARVVCKTSCSLVKSSRSRKQSSCGVFGTERFSQIMRGKNRFETLSKTCHFGSATMGENYIS